MNLSDLLPKKPDHIDVNFIIPEPAYAKLLKGDQIYPLLGVLGVVIFLATGVFFANNMLTLRSLEAQLDDLNANMVEVAPEVSEHLELQRQLEQDREDFQKLTNALPEKEEWNNVINNVVRRLPDIGTYSPAITLNQMRLTTSGTVDPVSFNLTQEDLRRIGPSISLTGQAESTEVVTTAVQAFEEDPRYAVAFRGTSGQGNAFSFAVDLVRLKGVPDPVQEGDSDEANV